MANEPLGDRKKALEDLFFSEVDQKLMDEMRARLAKEPDREALAKATNIKNKEVLDKLLDMGINASTLAAMTLVPLAAVAWADGSIEPAERDAILKAAEAEGMQPGSLAMTVLENWLSHSPGPQLLAAWKAYINELRGIMAPEWFTQMKTEIMDNAHRVAASAGGILGLIQTVSSTEQRKLDELKRAFEE